MLTHLSAAQSKDLRLPLSLQGAPNHRSTNPHRPFSLAFPTIQPRGVLPLNQGNLLRPRPTLQLLLTGDSVMDKRVSFKPDQPVAVVLLGMSLESSLLILPGSNFDLTSHANINVMTSASHNVAVIHWLTHQTRPKQIIHTTLPSFSHPTSQKLAH